MSVDRTDEKALQGLLIPDERWQYWSSQSTGVTQADPYPGEVRASRSTSAHLTASGTPTNGDTISLYAVQGGITGYNGARFVWLDGLAGNYRGWDYPKTIADYEVPGFTASIYGYRHPSVLALSDGQGTCRSGCAHYHTKPAQGAGSEAHSGWRLEQLDGCACGDHAERAG